MATFCSHHAMTVPQKINGKWDAAEWIANRMLSFPPPQCLGVVIRSCEVTLAAWA